MQQLISWTGTAIWWLAEPHSQCSVFVSVTYLHPSLIFASESRGLTHARKLFPELRFRNCVLKKKIIFFYLCLKLVIGGNSLSENSQNILRKTYE